MRKPILLLAAVALGTAACSSSGYSASHPAYGGRRPHHHHPTQPPYDPYEPEQPPATPYDGVTYQDPGVNPYVPADRDRESTFALDVDTASYAIAQRYVMDGNLPDPASVRAEEFVNAFDQDYAAPDRRHVRDQQRRRPQPVPRRGRGAPPRSASRPRRSPASSDPTPRSRSSSTPRARWPARTASASSSRR